MRNGSGGSAPGAYRLDPEQLRLIAHPLRQRILRLLTANEMTTRGLRTALGQAPSNLYHHVDRLSEAGLIEVTRSEQRRGAVERHYRAVATAFTVSPDLVTTVSADRSEAARVLAVVRTLMEDTFQSFASSLGRGTVLGSPEADPPLVNGIRIRTTPARMRALRRRLVRWLRDVAARPSRGPDGVECAGLLLLFPTDANAVRSVTRRGPKRRG